MIPYGKQSISEGDVDAVAAALRSDWLTTGPRVDRFERQLADAVGAVGAVAVTSGTAALHVAYRAAGVGDGDEVVTTPLTFVATASTAALLGARIVFADVEEETGNLSVQAAEHVVTSRTRAITAVDYAGVPVNPHAFRELAQSNDAVFIEDAAHSVGASWDGTPVGRGADLTALSFFPTKNLTTAEGGAVVSSSEVLLSRARSFRNHGLVREPELMRHDDVGPWHQEVHEFGLNYRLPDVLAALGSSQLTRLESFVARRREIHRRYSDALADLDGVTLPTAPPFASPAWHLYPMRVPSDRRREVFEALRARGIGVQVNYIPVYWHPVFEDLGYRRGTCPVAEEYYRQEISLPLFPALADAQIDEVIDAVRAVLA